MVDFQNDEIIRSGKKTLKKAVAVSVLFVGSSLISYGFIINEVFGFQNQKSTAYSFESSSFKNRKKLNHHCPREFFSKKLLIDLLAVGEGDSTFILTPNGVTILIDAGNTGRGRKDIIPTLRKCYNVTSLDYVILTHPHSDHFGGMREVLKAFPINKAIYDTGPSGGTAFKKYEVLANSSGKRKTPTLGEGSIIGDESVHFKFVAVNGNVLGGKSVKVFGADGAPVDKNSVSIALKITYGKFKYFTGGDLSGGGNNSPDVESAVSNIVGPVDIMKADHHGSATANNKNLLEALQPTVVLISVGDGASNKRYHLPNVNTMTRLLNFPFIKSVVQTAHGEGRAPAGLNRKIHNANSDIIVIASEDLFSVNGAQFHTKEK